MKPVHVIILALAAGLFLFAFWYSRKKMLDVQNAEQQNLVKGAAAIATITTVVDPTTGQEFIISDLGENNVDGGVDTRKMKVELIKVITDINLRSGVTLKTLTLKTYDPKMNLLSSTTVANPYKLQLPFGVAATPIQTPTGIDYSCGTNGSLNGPGFYNSAGGSLFFGMFCNK